MVTRTLTTTVVQALCLDIESGDPYTQEIILPRTFRDTAHILKAVRKELEDDKVKVAHISSYKVEEGLYGMTEAKFIRDAEKLPPRTTKA